MTAIAGLRTPDGAVYIAADSEMTWGGDKHQGSKIVQVGALVFAHTGYSGVSVALQHHLREPRVPEGDLDHHLAVVLPDAMRNALKEMHLWEDSKGVNGGGALVLGFRDRLVSYDCHLAAYPAERGFVAHGSGGAVALGAIHALTSIRDDVRPHPEKILLAAIEAATIWSVGVGGTPSVVAVPPASQPAPIPIP